MTFYRELAPVQEPFDLGTDTNNRLIYGFNVFAASDHSDTFLEDLKDILEAATVATDGTDLFRGSRAVIPTGDGPYLHLRHTGGAPPDRTHNQINPPATIQPSAQVTVRGKSYGATKLMARNAYLALNVRNSEHGDVVIFPALSAPDGQGPLRVRVYNTTTDATPTELYRDGTALRILIPSGATFGYTARIVCHNNTGDVSADYEARGTIANNGGTTAFVDTPFDPQVLAETDASYGVTVTADDTNDALVFTVTGAGHWEADVHLQRSAG